MKFDPHIDIYDFDAQTGIMRLLLILLETHDWALQDKPSTRDLAAVINATTLEKIWPIAEKKYNLIERVRYEKRKVATLTENGLKVANALKTIESTLQHVLGMKKHH